MLLKRWISGLVFGAIVFAGTWFGQPYFSVLLAAVVTIGAFEFYRIIGIPKNSPLALIGTIGALLFIVVAHFGLKYTGPLLAVVIALPLIWLTLRVDIKTGAASWAWLVAGMLYIGWMMSHFVLLRELKDGRDWVLLAVIATIVYDTTAFHFGLKWGRHRMAPRISPGKTWEGTIAGFIAAVAALPILVHILPQIDIPYWHAIIIGVLIGIFAPLGDLAESMLKRTGGVKDSGNMVPGHGGILDRMDSELFTIVVVYYYVLWMFK